jgi:glycosyltransferase involved in cell wall biosynthesis
MAAGRTIVASEVPPMAALLEAGRTAWLCRPRDPQDGARYMLKALDEPVVSARLAAAAREKALALFSAPRMVKPTNCNGV